MARGKVLLAHGSGGTLSHELISSVFVRSLGDPVLRALDDSAVVPVDGAVIGGAQARIALTTDSYVVRPLFFPGGDIGRIAVCGTVNDLAMVGARPRYLSAAFIVEEGFAIADLKRVVASMKQTAREAGVRIVTGDTKVVEHGAADGLFVTTAGVGVVPTGRNPSGSRALPGDIVLVSGPIANHGISVLLARENLGFVGSIQSDVAPLSALVEAMFAVTSGVHVLRDPTRGGLATTLVEIARQSSVAIRIEEARIPVDADVQAACEVLGYDPLYVANEGKLVAVVDPNDAEAVLAAMRGLPEGRKAAIVGEVRPGPEGQVTLATRVGGSRIVDMLTGGQFPRIC